MICKQVFISGKVQGVYYRVSMQRQALSLDIKGFVKNLDNGQVYAEVYGSKEAIEKLVSWCSQGPEQAEVIDVQAIAAEPREIYKTFEIRR